MSAPDLRNPLKIARGLGSSRSGLAHWWTQRITAVALIPLGLWLVGTVLGRLHSSYAVAHATVARPWNVILLSALLVIAFWHAERGLQVVVEDWISSRRTQVVLRILIQFVAAAGALASLLALLQIALQP